jgi:hypothetical protein
MPDEIPQNMDVPVEVPAELEPQTAQVPVSEPFVSEAIPEPEAEEIAPAPAPQLQTEPVVILTKPNPVRDLAKDLLGKARFAVQTRKRVKLERIMTLFVKRTNITNDEVEKFLHVSDSTATRYLEILEKENKIKQVGKTGKGVTYTKI